MIRSLMAPARGREVTSVMALTLLLSVYEHHSPWLLLVPLGMALAVMHRDRWFWLHAVLIPVTVLNALVYLAFVAGGGADLIYHNARYWLPLMPYWAILAALAVQAVAGWITKSRPRAQGLGDTELPGTPPRPAVSAESVHADV